MWYCLGMIGQRYLKISKHGEEQREMLRYRARGRWYLMISCTSQNSPRTNTELRLWSDATFILASVHSCKIGLSLAASCLSLQGLYNVGVMTLFLTPFVSNSLHFSRLARRVAVQCHCQVWGAQRQWTTSGMSISSLIITLNVPLLNSLTCDNIKCISARFAQILWF